MHAHGIQQRKLSRQIGPRRALLRGLLDALILYERIETTEAKAKELKPRFDKLVTLAKRQNLHSYRMILSEVINPVAAQKLNYELVKGFTGRNSGYTRLIKTGNRRGDNAPMVVVELALDDNYVKQADEAAKKAAKPDDKADSKKKAKESKHDEATVVRKTTAKTDKLGANVRSITGRNRRGDK